MIPSFIFVLIYNILKFCYDTLFWYMTSLCFDIQHPDVLMYDLMMFLM